MRYIICATQFIYTIFYIEFVIGSTWLTRIFFYITYFFATCITYTSLKNSLIFAITIKISNIFRLTHSTYLYCQFLYLSNIFIKIYISSYQMYYTLIRSIFVYLYIKSFNDFVIVMFNFFRFFISSNCEKTVVFRTISLLVVIQASIVYLNWFFQQNKIFFLNNNWTLSYNYFEYACFTFFTYFLHEITCYI